FGTKVTLKNTNSSENETFTLLGPWQSDPVNNIISYLSPFGNELLGSSAGDKLNFTINEREFDYEIISVESAV
ncbi:MAG: hypothetical protein GY760_19610, partial [Deltaproteobacteria bacterium]|nr:hypothetical protein [Deltaproteobacteria bacterium]